MNWMKVVFAAAALAVSNACSAPRPLPARGDWVFPIAHARCVDDRFAATGKRLLAGFPESIATDSFRVGDRLLFGFESFVGEVVTRFYVVMSSEADDDSSVRDFVFAAGPDRRTLPTHDRTVLVRVYDESLALVDEQRSLVPTVVHETGLYGWARAKGGKQHDALPLWETPRALPPTPLAESKFAWRVALELMAGMSRNRALCDRLRTLAVWPSMFQQLGLLFGGVDFDCNVRWARLVPQPIPELPGELCYEIELMLRQDRSPLLVGNAVVVPPVGPLAMSAGIVTIAGYRGDDPQRHFVARLLAMRQAPASDASEVAHR